MRKGIKSLYYRLSIAGNLGAFLNFLYELFLNERIK